MRLPAVSSREILLLMIAASAVNFFGRTSISIAAPEIMGSYGLSAEQMGGVYSAFAAAYALAMIPASPLPDRFGPRRVLGLAGLLTASCIAATGLAGLSRTSSGILTALIAIRFLFGLSAAPLYPACGRLSANWFEPGLLGRIQGFVVGAGSFGNTLAPVVIAALMRQYGWQFAFYCGAVATAFVFTLWLARVRDHPPVRQAPKRVADGTGRWQDILCNRQLLVLALSYFCVGYLYDLYDYWTYYYFREVRQFGEGPSAVFTTAAQASAMVMMPLGGWVSDLSVSRWMPQWGRRTVPMSALTLSGICLYAGANSSGAPATVALFCVAFGLAASVEGVYWASVLQIGGSHSALAYGFVNAGGNVGSFVSPLVLPRVAARFGWTAGLALASVVALMAALSWVFVKTRDGARTGTGAVV